MSVYEKKSLVKCGVDELFAFHLDTANLQAISPKNIKVTLLKLRTLKNFIPIIWEVKIETLKTPNLLVDIAMKSPFKTWKHSHIFTHIDEDTCELRDVVEYSLPFVFLNFLFERFVENELVSMFEHRHRVTKELSKRMKKIKNFCMSNFGVEFDMFSKIDVNGDNTHPLYVYLKEAAGGFITDTIKWNFTKFLVDRDGKVIKRYAPSVKPSEIEADIKKLL